MPLRLSNFTFVRNPRMSSAPKLLPEYVMFAPLYRNVHCSPPSSVKVSSWSHAHVGDTPASSATSTTAISCKDCLDFIGIYRFRFLNRSVSVSRYFQCQSNRVELACFQLGICCADICSATACNGEIEIDWIFLWEQGNINATICLGIKDDGE